MNLDITFTTDPIPLIILAGQTLADNGFTPGTLIAVQQKDSAFYISIVNDPQRWQALCEESENRADLSADCVRDDGELIIGGDWLTDIDITQPEHIDITTAPGRIEVRRRTLTIFKA